MKTLCYLTFAAVFVVSLSTQTNAQVYGGAPWPTPPPPQQAPRQQIPQQQLQPSVQANVCERFIPLRQDAEKGMAALTSANERKAAREEFCQIFQQLSVATSKITKFLEQYKSQCQIPAEVIQRAKVDHGKIATYRKQACSTPPVAGPKLSDVLGAPLPDATANKPNDNIFNTLTGNPLTR